MALVQYKYSILWDIRWAFRTIKNWKWLKDKKLAVFKPKLSKTIWLWFNMPQGPKIETDSPVTCYWISSGTWGSYSPPNKIFICPRGLKNIEKVIRHEITHLAYDHDVVEMSHEQKEGYINRKEKIITLHPKLK
jgi:hypothetical protein